MSSFNTCVKFFIIGLSGKLVSRKKLDISNQMTDDTKRGSRGPAPQWNLGRTRTIRVPRAIANQIVEIARKVDSGEVKLEMLLTQEEKQELSKSS